MDAIGGTGADQRGLRLDLPLETLLERIQLAERSGCSSVWAAHTFDHDPLMVMALAGALTKRVELGTAVLPTYARHPVTLAQQALTAQAATGNRFTLGIGVSHRFIVERWLGLDYAQPVGHARRYLSVLVPLLRTGRVRDDELLLSASVGVAGTTPPDVLLAALGPRMLTLGGAMANGVITAIATADHLEQVVVPTVRRTAEQAGRPSTRIVACTPILLTHDVDRGREAMAERWNPLITDAYRANLVRMGLSRISDVALVGDERVLTSDVARMRNAGVTDFAGLPSAFAHDPEAYERTVRFLGSLN